MRTKIREVYVRATLLALAAMVGGPVAIIIARGGTYHDI